MTFDTSTFDPQRIFALIQARTGLHLSDHQREEVPRLLQDRLQSKLVNGISQMMLILAQEPLTHPLWDALIKVITVGETYFYRNADQFNALRRDVLMPLIAQRRKSNRKELRLWSAGCATGEEPYSLAMLLVELLPDIAEWSITVLASDLNAASLERAEQGIYRSWSFRNETPTALRDRFFKANGDSYLLIPAIKKMVRFFQLNLIADEYPSPYNGTVALDVILCRNVTIYFDQKTTEDIAQRFCRCLNDDGWLVVGHAEPLATVYQGFTPRNFTNTVIYQKNAPFMAAEVPYVAPPPPPPPIKVIPQRQSAPVPIKETPKASTPAPVNYLKKAKEAADQEQWADALKWLTKAEKQNKFEPHVYYLRALVQLHDDDQRAALTSLRQALYCEPSFVLAHYTLGEIHAKAGDHKLAIQHWQQAQGIVSKLAPDAVLSDELTAEMLESLLSHRISILPPTREDR
jgi:chemotaxis protein methyltransferase CheR